MRRKTWVGVVLLTSVLSLTGCESVSTRIKEREAVYRGWSQPTQERIKRGEIKVGDGFDMVYVALGSPDEMETFTVKNGGVLTIWGYPKIKQRLAAEETVNYEDVSDYNIATGERVHYQVPNRQKVFRTEKSNGMQVIFRDGAVTSVRWGGSGPPAAATAATE